MIRPITWTGGSSVSLIRYIGELSLLVAEIFQSLIKGRLRTRQVMQQIAEIGYRSQPVVMVTGAFTGAVLTAQSLFQFEKFGMQTMGGALVSVSMLRELGPVVTGLMLAGRVGSAMAAEIGTMKVTEQIDALRVMDVHPVDFLVAPRLLAMLLAIPLLITESVTLGIIASNLVGIEIFGVGEAYWKFQMEKFTDLTDVSFALIKGVVFGLIIIVVSCHQGLTASQGAAGVGRGTTRAMVYSSLFILVTNFILTLLLNQIFPAGEQVG
jgi:phospholipid/cholesterol/gamma-HCH transport system permease protein